jgi:rhodanese-related sulfurtransferase
MRFIPFVHEGLGNSSYVVELGNGDAAVIDPDRSVDRYLRTLNDRGLSLKAILETHLHADFVSGAHEMSARTDAPIFAPAAAQLRLPHRGLHANEIFRLDGCIAKAIPSPGHTPEHLSYVLQLASGEPLLFTGGSLIVGGAARTDLISHELTDGLTRAQFRTIKQSFTEQPDETILLPTHGGGSFCSTGQGGERVSTLCQERANNPLLAWDDEDQFARWFPSTFPQAPAYFFRLRHFNQAGPRLRGEVRSPRPMTPEEFDDARALALVIDVRQKEPYSAGHIPASLSNPFRDSFAVWLGWVVPLETPLLFVADGEPLDRVIDESLLVGFENFVGYLTGGLLEWEQAGKPVATVDLVNPTEARRRLTNGALVLDVREPSEFDSGHLPGARQIPLGSLERELQSLPKERPAMVYCGHGERASTAASLLERAGVAEIANIDGGTQSWEAAGFPVEK